MVPLHAGIDRATHLFHPYPAKLLPNIPLFFLRCSQLGPPGHLRDPFCGSGTVLLEGAINGWRISGADANPLARLISKAKLTYLEPAAIHEACNRVCARAALSSSKFAPVVKVDYWFPKKVQQVLGGLVDAIDCETNYAIREFLQATLSSCVRKVSLADPRLSVPVRSKPGSRQWRNVQCLDVMEHFRQKAGENARRIGTLREIDPAILHSLILSHDARGSKEELEPSEDTDLIITSPPYAGAQKYIRASSLSIGWLRMAPANKLRNLERLNIGREHFSKEEYSEQRFPKDGLARVELERIWTSNPLRAHIAATYLREMRDALVEARRRLRCGGQLILISGNNTIVGKEFPTSEYLSKLVETLGLRLDLELVDKIRSRGLMTKRNKTAGLIRHEHIHVFTKP